MNRLKPIGRGIAAYLYVIEVKGVIRYVGKGRGERMFTHLADAQRSAAKRVAIANLHPRMRRKLVEAARQGSSIIARVIKSGLSNSEAYRLESEMIADFHKRRTGQLWNTIDERYLPVQALPEQWDDPEHPLYRLPRPLRMGANRAKRGPLVERPARRPSSHKKKCIGRI